MFRLEYQMSEYYKAYDSEVVELGEIFGEYGEFQMYVNDKVYKEYYYPEDPDRWEEPLYIWFYYLMESIILLEDSDYVLIRDIETIDLWVEVKRYGEELYISIAAMEQDNGGPFIRTTHKEDIEYEYFKDEQVSYSEFCFEVVNKAEQYLLELKELNCHVNKRVPRFENKLLEAKKLWMRR